MSCLVCDDHHCLAHCVWCGVGCETPSPLHDPACPHATGVYPAHGDECCCTCGEPVDVYVLRYRSDVGYVTCLGCEVLDRQQGDNVTDLSDLVFDENERSVPCEACDGDGAVMLEAVSVHEQPEDRMAVCRACEGWGWREP